MAFPACTILEKIYRNSISDVADYLHYQYSDNYLILNVSNRQYDYSKFEDRVKDYEWHDHQAPPLTTLIQLAFTMFHFLHSNSIPMQITRKEWSQFTVITGRGGRGQGSYLCSCSLDIKNLWKNASSFTTPRGLVHTIMELTSLASWDIWDSSMNWCVRGKLTRKCLFIVWDGCGRVGSVPSTT